MKSSGESTSQSRPEVVEEYRRIAERANRDSLPLRLLGGVAVRLRAKDGLNLGYTPHVRFNSMYGQERLLFFDREHDRQVDILVGTFRMSHEIRLGKRLDMEPLTIPLVELLLTKLQIVELNEKINTTERGAFL
jgi:hypothetical protein